MPMPPVDSARVLVGIEAIADQLGVTVRCGARAARPRSRLGPQAASAASITGGDSGPSPQDCPTERLSSAIHTDHRRTKWAAEPGKPRSAALGLDVVVEGELLRPISRAADSR